MGYRFICLAIIGAIIYGTPVYGGWPNSCCISIASDFDYSKKCFLETTQSGCDWFANAENVREPQDVPCIWIPSGGNAGICTKPCHLRSVDECNTYNDSSESHNKFCKVDGDRCVPECGNISTEGGCKTTIGCVWDSTEESCSGCKTGEYYQPKISEYCNEAGCWGQSPTGDREWFNCQVKTVGEGKCVSCDDNSKPDGANWLESSTNTIGACAWAIRCPVGFGLVKSNGCNSCPPGNTSLEQSVVFIPDGTQNQEVSKCGEPCPKGYYCDGEHGQQQCPCATAKQEECMTTDGTGKISQDDCMITKDTVFCDSKGCFKLPLGNKTIYSHAKTQK